MSPKRYVVVGAGIVGLATAREINRRQPDAEVVVVDKETAVATHQTSHNSGVVHAGLYYGPGSLKAKLCTRGRRMLKDFCEENQLPYEECGKLIVARDSSEISSLRQIEARSVANQVPDLSWRGPAELREIEPHAAGVAALHSPHTAITDFPAIAGALASSLDVRLRFEVTSVHERGREVVLGSPAGEMVADEVVICAGLQADRVARLAGDGPDPEIIPFRGEYWRLVPERSSMVRGLIYPVPDPRYPFLGVHFTRRIGGEVDLGPNAVLALHREGYRMGRVDPREVSSLLRSPAFRAMARHHWKTGIREMRGSLSKAAFVRAAARLVPEVTGADVVRAPAGVRAQAVQGDGSLVDDFRIHRVGRGGRMVAVRNAPSPAATSCLAIAEYIVDEVEAEARSR